MRRKLQVASLIAVMLLVAGCAKKVVAPVPGQINTFDATAYRWISDAQAAINSVKADQESGKIVLNETQKKVLNQAITDYNFAQAAWHAYHSGATSDAAGLQNALYQLINDITNLTSQLPKTGGSK